MNNRILSLLAVFLGVCAAVVVYAAFVLAGVKEQNPSHIQTLPKITSCVSALKVQSSFFRKRDPNSNSLELVIQLMNDSDTSVVAVSVEWTSKQNHTKHSLVTSSFGADTPRILAMPHSLYEIAIPVANFPPDAIVKVGSAMFADNKEEGCAASLKELRERKSKEEKKSPKDSKEQQK